MLNEYYRRISHLRFALPIVNDIRQLENCLRGFNRNITIATLTRVVLKYETELEKIAFFHSGRNVIKGDTVTLYGKQSNDALINDINYLIDCLIIIGAVRFGLAPSLETVLNQLYYA